MTCTAMIKALVLKKMRVRTKELEARKEQISKTKGNMAEMLKEINKSSDPNSWRVGILKKVILLLDPSGKKKAEVNTMKKNELVLYLLDCNKNYSSSSELIDRLTQASSNSIAPA